MLSTFHEKILSYKQTFATSMSSASSVAVARITMGNDQFSWQGECSPRAYVTGQTTQTVLKDFEDLEAGHLAVDQLRGSSAFAYNTAMIGYKAKQAQSYFWEQVGIDTATALKPKLTAYTLSLDEPQKMAEQALAQADFKILKLKIDGDVDKNIERLAAIKKARPDVSIYLDANQAIQSLDDLDALVQQTMPYDVQLIEQPFAKASTLEQTLTPKRYTIPIFADESCSTADDVAFLAQHYDGVNIKLDKCGGLENGAVLAKAAKQQKMQLMVGCMGASSMSIYPALLLANQFDINFIDLDGAYLTIDDTNFVRYYEGMVAINKAAFN